MTAAELDAYYQHCIDLKQAEQRRQETSRQAADNWRATHTGPYRITDRAVGPGGEDGR